MHETTDSGARGCGKPRGRTAASVIHLTGRRGRRVMNVVPLSLCPHGYRATARFAVLAGSPLDGLVVACGPAAELTGDYPRVPRAVCRARPDAASRRRGVATAAPADGGRA